MNRINNLSFIRRAGYALLLGWALLAAGCVPVTTISTGTGVGMPPEDADYALQKLTVEGAEFVPLVRGADGLLHPAHPGRELETTNNLATPFDLTPAREWWLRSDERVAPTIRRHVGEYIDEDRVITTCDFCAFAPCLDNATLTPVTPSFNLLRTPPDSTQSVNLLEICQTRRRLQLTPTGDELLSLNGLDLPNDTLAQMQLRVVAASGPRTFTSPALKLLPAGSGATRFFFATDDADPASLPGPEQRWSVNFSPASRARTLELFQQGGGLSPEPVNFTRVNAVNGCITSYDLSGNPTFDAACLTPERFKCNPVNGNGRIELQNTAFCPQGAVNATPNYFLGNSNNNNFSPRTDAGFSPRTRIFWIIEFDGGAPALAPGRELVLRFTF